MNENSELVIREFVVQDKGLLGLPLDLVSIPIDELIGFQVPLSFRQWLSFANGCCVGHGGVFGVKTRTPIRDVLDELKFYTQWRAREWLPVGWDGFGNLFVADCDSKSPATGQVWFFDLAASEDKPIAVVAASFNEFLEHFLSEEVRAGTWPGI